MTLHRTYWRERTNPRKQGPSDEQLPLFRNTLEAPAGATGSETCATAVKTFLNQDHCIRQQTCAATSYGSATFALDETNLRRFYTVGS
eukprot:115747-Prymnesium_polylepis.1